MASLIWLVTINNNVLHKADDNFIPIWILFDVTGGLTGFVGTNISCDCVIMTDLGRS